MRLLTGIYIICLILTTGCISTNPLIKHIKSSPGIHSPTPPPVSITVPFIDQNVTVPTNPPDIQGNPPAADFKHTNIVAMLIALAVGIICFGPYIAAHSHRLITAATDKVKNWRDNRRND